MPIKIAVNALKDEAEAEKILHGLQNEIKRAWQEKDAIEPCFEGPVQPSLPDILYCCQRPNAGRAMSRPAWCLPCVSWRG
jgi:ArsR family metal-binding transcriptional regulator